MAWLGRLGPSRFVVSALAGIVAAGCAETGAHLTFSAPEGPQAVTSFRVILATPDVIPNISDQRVAPGALETHSVSYFYQRTIAGGTSGDIDGVDGFAVRIAPDPSMADTKFIPFVLMYEGDTIVGVGTFRATDSVMPSPILVVGHEIDKYVLDVEPAVQVTELDTAANGQVRVVECFRDDDSMFTSGIVWRPKSGGELRLLFPEDGGLDATERALDLDCDGRAVTVESSEPDCDDSRGLFHHGARETCDGLDTNCDGVQSLVVACTGADGTCASSGVALCDDVTGEETVCQPDPQCACETSPTGCARCLIGANNGSATGMVQPCQPSIGYVYLGNYGCTEQTRCTVDVLEVNGGWKAEVANDSQAPTFGLRAMIGYKGLLKVKRPEGPSAEIMGTHGASTGDVSLGITAPDGSVHLLAIDLQFEEGVRFCQGQGPFQMTCTP